MNDEPQEDNGEWAIEPGTYRLQPVEEERRRRAIDTFFYNRPINRERTDTEIQQFRREMDRLQRDREQATGARAPQVFRWTEAQDADAWHEVGATNHPFRMRAQINQWPPDGAIDAAPMAPAPSIEPPDITGHEEDHFV